MTLKNIIILCGPTLSGKTTVLNYLVENYPHLKQLITTTTRPKRPGEPENTYHFVDDETFKNADIIAPRAYKVANGRTWYYGLNTTELEHCEAKTAIMILDLVGIKEMQAKLDQQYRIIPLHVKISLQDRFERALKRDSNNDLRETLRRMYVDEFVDFTADKYPKNTWHIPEGMIDFTLRSKKLI